MTATLEALEKRLSSASVPLPHQTAFTELDKLTARCLMFIGRSLHGLPRPPGETSVLLEAGHLYTRLYGEINDYDERRRFSRALEGIGQTPAGDWEGTIQTAYAQATSTTPIRGNNDEA